MVSTNLHSTSGNATVYGGDFGGRAQGNWDGKAYGFNTATGVPMNEVTNSVAMHDTSLKYHIVRVTNHDTNLTKYALVTNVMGNPKSSGDLTPELAESLGVKLTEEPYHDSSLNQDFRLVKGDDARNLTFEVVGELKNKNYADVATAKTVANKLAGIKTAEDIKNFDDENAQLYPEFKAAVASNGIDYKPESKASVGAIARLGAGDKKRTEQEAVATLTKGFEHNPDESDDDHKKRLKNHMNNNLAFLPPEEQAFFTAIMALIMFAMGDTAGASALLEGVSPSISDGNYNQYEPALSSTGTGGRRYNQQTQDYDGENSPSSTKVLGNYSKIVDVSQLESSDSTLKAGSIGALRDKIKVEYTSRLDPFLFKGGLKDIPPNTPVFVADLGHLGKGSDLGAGMMTSGGYLCEAGACMESNLAMIKKLSDRGVIILSTTQSPRFENNTLSPSARQEFTQAVANQVGKENTFFVSTHFNDASSQSVNGASMFVDKRNPAALAYANEIQGALTSSGGFKQFEKGIFDEHESQHKSGLSVTTNSYPSVLAELGFLKGDAEKLTNKAYMQKVGETMADAVLNVGTEKFAWKVKETETQIAEKAPVQQPAEAAPANKEFAALVAGKDLKLDGVSLPKPDENKSASLTDAVTVAKESNLLLATQTQRTKDGYPPKVPESVSVTPDPATQSPAVGS